MHFKKRKNASQKLRENACSVYIMVIVNSHHQGFLGEPFKIIIIENEIKIMENYLHIKQIDELKYEMQR